jgi:hypothetical protein
VRWGSRPEACLTARLDAPLAILGTGKALGPAEAETPLGRRFGAPPWKHSVIPTLFTVAIAPALNRQCMSATLNHVRPRRPPTMFRVAGRVCFGDTQNTRLFAQAGPTANTTASTDGRELASAGQAMMVPGWLPSLSHRMRKMQDARCRCPTDE